MSKRKRTYSDWNDAMMAGKRVKSKGVKNELVAGEIVQKPRLGVRVEGSDFKPSPFRVKPEDMVAGEPRQFWDLVPRR